MTRTLVFHLRQTIQYRINAASWRLDEWADLSADQIAEQSISVNPHDGKLGDLFEVTWTEDDQAESIQWRIEGDLAHVDGIGKEHRRGSILIDGDVGDYVGACMTGGRIRVAGNAGDHAGAATGSRGVGMNGGQLRISGNAGRLAGHRMRRGELMIGGSAEDGLAAWQVAGTIVVAGKIGRHVAYGMRRGTLIVREHLDLPTERFTEPVPVRSPMASLFQTHLKLHELGFPQGTWQSQRGDRAIGGLGEIWSPA